MSSLENITKEAIQCLAFVDSYTRKQGEWQCVKPTVTLPRFGAVIVPYSVRSRARFREFVHTLGQVVAKPTHQRVCAVATRRNTQN